MLVFRVREHKVPDQASASLDLTTRSQEYEAQVDPHLVNNILRILSVCHELLYKRVDTLEFDFRFPFKDLPEIELFYYKVILLIVMAFTALALVSGTLVPLCQLLAIFI